MATTKIKIKKVCFTPRASRTCLILFIWFLLCSRCKNTKTIWNYFQLKLKYGVPGRVDSIRQIMTESGVDGCRNIM